MPRPHTEFIQAQTLPWVPMAAGSARPGAAEKVLSRDPDSGARSSNIRYPAGWNLPEAHQLACDEELFVLAGTIVINGRSYGSGDYAYLPAGYCRSAMNSANGCVILTFFEGETQPAESAGKAGYDATLLIERLETAKMPWISASDPKVARSGVGRKVLRPDTQSGERTWIMRMKASESEPMIVNGVERHPCVEEMFQLEGEFAMTVGMMRAGAYFWRPPGIAHGPMGSKTDFMALFRAKEGAFSTNWSEPEVPLPWDAAYRPILPDRMKPFSRKGYDSTEAW